MKKENYQREGSYNKSKGELLGKIKFMLKDGPRYISIHEVSKKNKKNKKK
jgi:hypothetical protein